jgi:uncharacterized protein
MAGEALEAARLERGGIPFDRSAALFDVNPSRADAPFTARHQHRMLQYQARVRDGAIFVQTPQGYEFGLDDGGWLEAMERDVDRRLKARRGAEPIHDAADVLVLNAASLRALAAEYRKTVNPLRFRPNLVVDGPDMAPFEESRWLGKRFSAGSAVLEAVEPCKRCVLTTIDPATFDVDPSFLRLVVERHASEFGVYFRVVQPGAVRVGDTFANGSLEVKS